MTLRELLKQNELHFPLMRIPYHTPYFDDTIIPHKCKPPFVQTHKKPGANLCRAAGMAEEIVLPYR